MKRCIEGEDRRQAAVLPTVWMTSLPGIILSGFAQAVVAIDSSKFKAVNSRDRNFAPNKIAKRQEQIEQSIQRYLDAMETADRTQPAEAGASTARRCPKLVDQLPGSRAPSPLAEHRRSPWRTDRAAVNDDFRRRDSRKHRRTRGKARPWQLLQG